jgi:hypothetical protein
MTNEEVKVVGGCGAAVLLAVFAFGAYAIWDFRHGAATPSSAIAAPYTPPPPLPKPMNVEEAIRAAGFADASGVGGPHQSAGEFAKWAMGNLTLQDVGDKVNPSTTHKQVLRDADRERGKRICLDAWVNQIECRDTQWGRMCVGLAHDLEGFYLFTAVHDTADVYKGSVAPFCGIVVGRESFTSTENETTHAIRLVGMFITDENAKSWRGTPKPQ